LLSASFVRAGKLKVTLVPLLDSQHKPLDESIEHSHQQPFYYLMSECVRDETQKSDATGTTKILTQVYTRMMTPLHCVTALCWMKLVKRQELVSNDVHPANCARASRSSCTTIRPDRRCHVRVSPWCLATPSTPTCVPDTRDQVAVPLYCPWRSADAVSSSRSGNCS
jgi:hypothetical protein